ncbi:EF-hand domain-containing protein [Seohaeicola sp.]|uniref:EF-hand domain-containing protein n=1 Tax=Seohaeicola sp. TaxID=2042026 RepID=UPI003A83707F
MVDRRRVAYAEGKMLRTILLFTTVLLAAGPVSAQSAEPIRQVLADFDRIDADEDSVISIVEYRDLQIARWPRIDRNGDGYLTDDDFPRFAAARARRLLAEVTDLDANGDGRISRDEFVNGPAPLFRQADRNDDGVMTRTELEAAAAK